MNERLRRLGNNEGIIHRGPRVGRGYLVALVGVSVSVSFAIVLLVRHLQRDQPMGEAARDVLAAYVEGDAATLMRYVAHEEREASGLDEASLKELLDRVFAPAFEGCQLKSKRRSEFSSEVSYIHVGTFACKGGASVRLYAQIYVGDYLVSPSVAYNTVMVALTAYGRVNYPGISEAVARYKAYQDLRPIFESLRLKKVWLAFNERALSWKELEARLRDDAKREAAAVQPATGVASTERGGR